jgi:hypothetical protein
MELSEALELFEFESKFSETDIDLKFKELAAKHHPDRGGNTEKMAKVNIAKAALSHSLNLGKSLVPIEAIKDIVIATNKGIAAYEEKREASKAAATRIVDIHTSQPKKLKKMATIFGGIAAAGVFLGKDIPEKFYEGLGGAAPEYSAMFTVVGLGIGMYAAIFWWILDAKINRIEQETKDLENNLNDKVYLVDLIHQTLEGLAESSFDKDDLDRGLERWSHEKEYRYTSLSKLIRDAGERELSQLIIAKGLESEILMSRQVTKNKRLKVTFELNLTESEK